MKKRSSIIQAFLDSFLEESEEEMNIIIAARNARTVAQDVDLRRHSLNIRTREKALRLYN